MSEQWSEMEGRLKPSRSLEDRLRDHPELRAKMESLLAVVENAAGDVEKAAEAERRVTEELRQMGNEALHGWARRQALAAAAFLQILGGSLHVGSRYRVRYNAQF